VGSGGCSAFEREERGKAWQEGGRESRHAHWDWTEKGRVQEMKEGKGMWHPKNIRNYVCYTEWEGGGVLVTKINFGTFY